MKKFFKTPMKTDEFIIKDLELKEIEIARNLHNDNSVLKFLTDPSKVSKIQQSKWFFSLEQSSKSFRLIIFEKNSMTFVGIFRIDQLDLKNKSVVIGLDITPKQRGKKFSLKIYHYLLQYIYKIGINRVSLETLETNYVAINLYKKLGFKNEGRLREAIWRDGRFLDCIKFSLLKKEYLDAKNF
ncbi:MAG: hypothetical protein CMP34_01960 [Rickettsiales bacterium]|nr:hypothetical protein [Rickettsiales bacterium]|tara:strand:+ start:963 stop:1514 length:552 start_codon:yes stop_codon:yes gene_type:complete